MLHYASQSMSMKMLTLRDKKGYLKQYLLYKLFSLPKYGFKAIVEANVQSGARCNYYAKLNIIT